MSPSDDDRVGALKHKSGVGAIEVATVRFQHLDKHIQELFTAYKELADSIEHIGCGVFLGDGLLCGDGVKFLCGDCQKIADAKKKVDRLSKGAD